MAGRRRTRQEEGNARHWAGQSRKLVNAILSIGGCATLEDTSIPLLDYALALSCMDAGGVYWIEGKTARLCHQSNLPESLTRDAAEFAVSGPHIQALLPLREPSEMAAISPEWSELWRRHKMQHAYLLPLRGRDLFLGFLIIGSTLVPEPDKSAIHALATVIRQLDALFWRLSCEKALRRSEQRYRTIAETARDFIFVLDRDERVQYVNQSGAAALGLRADEIVGRVSGELFSPEVAAGHNRNIRRVIDSGEPLSIVERSRFGERDLWLMTHLNPMRAEDGEIQGVLGIARDITQQKEMEREIREVNAKLEMQVAQRTAELTNRARQLQRLTAELLNAEEQERVRLAEFLHDDLQQVLAAARFRLSMFDNRNLDDKTALDNISQVMQMLKEAIEKCRNLSQELGPPALYHGTLNEAFQSLSQKMEKKHGLVVQLEISGEVSSTSEAVRALLYRAGQEILFNVIKHAGVWEAVLRLQRLGDELWLTISDNGRGFEPELLGEARGFGLLSIRERVEFLGGRMTIRSAPGRGSTFTVVLPDQSGGE